MKLLTGGKQWAAQEKRLTLHDPCEVCGTEETQATVAHPDLGIAFGQPCDVLRVCLACKSKVQAELNTEFDED